MDSFLTVRMPNKSLDTPVRNAAPPTFLFWSPCLIHSKFTNTKHSGKSTVPEAVQHHHTISHAIVMPVNPPYPRVSNGAQGALRQMGRRKLTLCPDGNFGNGVGSVAGTGWTSAEQLFHHSVHSLFLYFLKGINCCVL